MENEAKTNIVLCEDVFLITPDNEDSNTGVIFRKAANSSDTLDEGVHVVFVRKFTAEVIVDGVKYLAVRDMGILMAQSKA